MLTRPAPPPDRTLRYGSDPDQLIDLRLPAEISKPLVVAIHGGFWRARWDRAHLGPFAADLVSNGWPVATLEFRRVGRDGGWPGTFEDVRAALDAVPGELGEPILTGHSAGGHLALWAAGEVPVRGVLALAPVADLEAGYAQRLGDDAVRELLGGGPAEVPDRYTAADPMRRPPVGPVTIVHGTEDEEVPIAISRRFAAAKGATLVELPGIEHFGVIDPASAAWPAVLTALSALTEGPDSR